MSPAGSGSAQFCGELRVCVGEQDLPLPDPDPPEPGEPRVTVQAVQSVLGRAQHLADTRPSGRYPVAWCVEAEHIGDLQAIGTLAVLAARSAQ